LLPARGGGLPIVAVELAVEVAEVVVVAAAAVGLAGVEAELEAADDDDPRRPEVAEAGQGPDDGAEQHEAAVALRVRHEAALRALGSGLAAQAASGAPPLGHRVSVVVTHGMAHLVCQSDTRDLRLQRLRLRLRSHGSMVTQRRGRGSGPRRGPVSPARPAVARTARRTGAGRAAAGTTRRTPPPAARTPSRTRSRADHADCHPQMTLDSTPTGMRRSSSICRSSSGDRPNVVR